jgi:hypothetical protein
MRGYYLIGYRPEESAFDATTGRVRFNSLKIVVKNRPELIVRTRTGFLSVSEEATARTQPRTRAGQLMGALTSPFGNAGVGLRLTSLFINNDSGASVMRSMLLIDPRTLTFKQHRMDNIRPCWTLWPSRSERAERRLISLTGLRRSACGLNHSSSFSRKAWSTI